MKAVILAGGKGSRLRPLTCNRPKPMVPLLGRPCMAYAVDLLQRAGIREIVVTLHAFPDVIRSYFGDGRDRALRMHYVEETQPLGTAGSVKNAARWLREPFVVMAGDAVTDFPLAEAFRYHRAHGALATVVLTRVEQPLAYGVAIQDVDGRIVRFLEKPSWGEVFSDTVNTGIYILEPDVLELIPAGLPFDFSHDLFPAMLRDGLPFYGYVADGYWSDIGTPAQYRQTQFDMLDGKVLVDIDGQRVAPRIWLAPSAQVAAGAVLTEPCYIGADAVIESGAQVGPYTVVGAGNVLHAGATLRRTVLGDHNVIGEGVELRGATVCGHTTIAPHAACFEGAIIGDACRVGVKAVLKPEVKLWPHKRVADGATVHTSLIWNETHERQLFGLFGVQGVGNVELTPEFAGKLAAAYGAVLPGGAQVVVTADDDPFAQLLQTAFMTGLRAAGLHALDGGVGTTPLLRYAVRDMGADGGVHVRRCSGPGEERLLIEFVDGQGLNLDKGLERKIDNAYRQEDFRRARPSSIGQRRVIAGLQARYRHALLQAVDHARIQSAPFRVAVEVPTGAAEAVVRDLLVHCAVDAVYLHPAEAAQGELPALVARERLTLGVRLCENAERLALVTEQGVVIEAERLLALQVLVYLTAGGRAVAVPVTAPTVVQGLAAQFQAAVVRTQAHPRALMEPMAGEAFPLFFDACSTLIRMLDVLARTGRTLTSLAATIPAFHIRRGDVACPWEAKGRVMRLLAEELQGEQVDMLDGIKVYADGGWTLIVPDADGPLLQIYAQGATEAWADAQVAVFTEKIRRARESSG